MAAPESGTAIGGVSIGYWCSLHTTYSTSCCSLTAQHGIFMRPALAHSQSPLSISV